MGMGWDGMRVNVMRDNKKEGQVKSILYTKHRTHQPNMPSPSEYAVLLP
jgi:hypothetical protein